MEDFDGWRNLVENFKMLCARVITQNRHMVMHLLYSNLCLSSKWIHFVANNTSGSGYVRSVGSAYGSRGSLAGESGGGGSVRAGSKGGGSVGNHRFFLGDINKNDCDGIGNIVRSQTAGGFNSQTSHNFGSFEVSLDMFS
ncbi:hypothetical protein DY000_02041464 [Brassica cretica]|uniref:Uncharacterized protein n=1 Tax=Brassica cretica TaxID=69181 RepID=A0ABQ7BPU0_BRACR|nr:hypothetical protein DY000_02041464 [Brassica cretica]